MTTKYTGWTQRYASGGSVNDSRGDVCLCASCFGEITYGGTCWDCYEYAQAVDESVEADRQRRADEAVVEVPTGAGYYGLASYGSDGDDCPF